MDRRDFLKNGSLLAGGLLLGNLGMTSCNSKPKPRKIPANEKVNLACIGIGNQGGYIIKALHNTGLCNVVALCDTDMGADHTLEIMNKFPDAPRFQDFRDLFDKMDKQFDAVCIGVPDHSHFPIAMLAMSRGKHVYVEKPMAHTFNEVELMIRAAEKYGVVTQMGNQGHSEANYFQFKTWVEAGIIKDVTAITAHMNNPRRWHGWDCNMKSMPAGEPVPSTLDWDTWLGTEFWHDYNHDYINGQWRCWYDFGMGALGDWGAHIIDTAHEFLHLGLPSEVEMLYAKGHNKFFYPYSSTIKFHFPEREGMPACDITWYDGLDNLPPVPAGAGTSVHEEKDRQRECRMRSGGQGGPPRQHFAETVSIPSGPHGIGHDKKMPHQ